MKVLLSGASGLIGSALRRHLQAAGHEVLALVRRKAEHPDQISWYPQDQTLDSDKLTGIDAVVHLAGESIAGGRWSPVLKQRILESRIQSTRLLARELCRMEQPPAVMVSASAVGYYGDRGASELREDAGPGQGFLSEVCQAWEAEAKPVEACGIRLVHARIAPVLSHHGGMLPPILLPFKLGLGGPLGPGNQFMSWIALTDIVKALEHCLLSESLSGPVNCCAPQPVINQVFTDTLARVLRRPAFLPAPAFALKLALGAEMAHELLLSSARAMPRRLQESGFGFRYPKLEDALRASIAGQN